MVPWVSDMRPPEVGRVIVMLLLMTAACTDGAGSSSTVTAVSLLDRSAAEFAASAERALEETAFEVVGSGTVADLVIGLCEGLGIGAVPAMIDGLGIDAPPGDREIVTEVLTVGMAQVCPDRASVDLTGFYLDAVRGTVNTTGALGAFDEGDVVRAGPIVCEILESGAGVEAALLATVVGLFGTEAGSMDQLAGLIDADQGVVSGAVLASATALLCPEHAGEVETFMESL